MSQQDNNQMQQHFYRASAADFGKIPGSPVAYWVGEELRESFLQNESLGSLGEARLGMATGNNDLHMRRWHEVSYKKVGIGFLDRNSAKASSMKWFPYNKGGQFRRWYGNNEFFVNWENDGEIIQTMLHPSGTRVWGHNFNLDYIFKPCLTFTATSSSYFGVRYSFEGFLFDNKGSSYFTSPDLLFPVLGFLASKPASCLLRAINPTIEFQPGNISILPFTKNSLTDKAGGAVKNIVDLSKLDWDAYETSWDFKCAPLLTEASKLCAIKTCYSKLVTAWNDTIVEMQRLEEENNRLFIEAYGLQDELTPEVPLSEITLTCNPYYRYGGNLTDEEREARLQSDTIAELISYAIGCMMGRYSLDREGLVYAHAGNEGFKALVEEGAYATFQADGDGILPLTSEAWFEDDVAARVEQFVRTVWGAEQLEENLAFIADSLCLAAIKPVKKGGETSRETIRRYLSSQFFKDHLKTYKKRPIYWLFSSGKEKAFECLVYLHRYNEATLPRMRTEYVTPLLGQMASRIERKRMEQTEASTAEAKRIAKEIDSLTKQLSELRAFDDQLKHHADMRISLDLDDGVKVNYGKFGTLLSDVKAITGDKGE